jgi:hypothetical protein
MHKELKLKNMNESHNLREQGINEKLVLKWFFTFIG